MKKIISSLILTFVSVISFGQISVTNVDTPSDLVTNILAGPGVTITNLTYNGSAPAGLAVQPQAGYFNANGTGFPITEGVVLSTGQVTDAANPATNFASTGFNGPGDPDLATFGAGAINDAVSIEFDFVPVGDSVSFNFIFASEEYPNFAPPNGGINDVFGFFLSGPGIAGPYTNGAENIAILPNGDDISINNINPVNNSAFYVANAGGTDHSYGGRSTVLTTVLPTLLNCGETYHFKIVLADASDAVYDTAIFLEASSFTSVGADISIIPVDSNGDPLINNELYEGCTGAQIILVKPAGYTDSTYVIDIATSGTALNGVDFSTLDPSYTISPGQDTLIVDIVTLADALSEGTETIIMETFYVNECGDTIFVTETINILDVAPDYNTVTTNDTTYVCPFDEFDVTAVSDGGVPNLSYDWGPFGTNQTATIPGNIAGTTTYTVNVTDACGITSTSSFDVTLNPAPLPIVDFNNNTGGTICPGEDYVIEVINVINSNDPGNETYDWYTINNPLTPGADSIPTVTPNANPITVAPTVETWFYVEVFDGCQTVTDSVRILMGQVDLTAINVVDALNCPGQAAPVLGEIEILPSTAGWQYTIVGAGSTLGPQAGNTFTNLTGNITYVINVTNTINGCETDTSIFVGSAVVATTADWVVPSLGNVSCFGDQNGTAEIENITGGLNSGPYDIIWTDEFGQTSELLGVPSGSGDAVDSLYGGPWVVTVIEQGSGCAWSEAFVIDEPSPLVVDLTNFSTPSCFGSNDGDLTAAITGGNAYDPDDVIFSNTNGPITTTSLTINNLIADTYTVSVTDLNGCVASNSLTLIQPNEIAIDFTLTDPSCYGEESGGVFIDQVYNYFGSEDSLNFLWTDGPNSVALNDNWANLGNYLRFEGEGAYSVMIVDSVGCTKSFDFVLTYPDSIHLELGIERRPVCRDNAILDDPNGQIFATASGGQNGNGQGGVFDPIEWVNLGTGETHNSSTWGGIAAGTYMYRVQNDLGCVKNATIVVDSLSPIASFNTSSPQFTSDYFGTAPVEVTFENTSQNYAFANDPLYYGISAGNPNPDLDTTMIWTFSLIGDPYTTEEVTDLTRVYLSEGLYTVCLEVIENMNGCVDSTCIDIQIYDVPELVTPNVFTPGLNGNGDGVNDIFFFPNTSIVEFEATFFNSWGTQIYSLNDINMGWDGSNENNGNDCSDGVYFYVYTATSANGTEFSGQGDVHLIRE